MNTKLLLAASALVLGAAGIAGSFLPHELLRAAGVAPDNILPLLVQLLSALLLAFGMTNWMSRGNLMGGIYNRPLAVGNLAHFLIGALALLKAVMAGQRMAGVVIAAVIYSAFAIAFAVVLFRSPVQTSTVSGL